MLALSLNYQHQVRERRGAPQYPDLRPPWVKMSNAFRLPLGTDTASAS